MTWSRQLSVCSCATAKREEIGRHWEPPLRQADNARPLNTMATPPPRQNSPSGPGSFFPDVNTMESATEKISRPNQSVSCSPATSIRRRRNSSTTMSIRLSSFLDKFFSENSWRTNAVPAGPEKLTKERTFQVATWTIVFFPPLLETKFLLP